jgi:hypothetical protein
VPAASRPPHNSSSPSARAAAVPYMRGGGSSPHSVMRRHAYGFSDVSSAQASPSVCLPSLPPMATRKRLATSDSACA